MANVELVVMAAGVGSRFGGLKQLEPVGPGGETLLDYAVFDAVRAGVDRVVVVVRRETAAEFDARLGRRWARRMEVAYAFQELTDLPAGARASAERSKPWGTGHAVLAARRAVRAPFLVINADDFYGAEGFALLTAFLSRPGGGAPGRYALVAFRLGNTLSEHGAVSRGVCRLDSSGQLVGIDEREQVVREADGSVWSRATAPPQRLDPDVPVSMNLWGFQPDLFAHLEECFAGFLAERGQEKDAEFFLPAAITQLIDTGQVSVQVLTTSATWFGLTHRGDAAQVRWHLADLSSRGVYPPQLWGA